MQVIVLGDAFVDILAGPLASLPRWGADVECPSISQLPGGSALNVAVQLGTLCDGIAKCTFHGLVGNDEFAHILRKRIAEAGVTDCLETSTNGVGTGVCLVLSGNGERAFVTQVVYFLFYQSYFCETVGSLTPRRWVRLDTSLSATSAVSVR
jgi:sugar/nucleoside kinase (ribokinase family)